MYEGEYLKDKKHGFGIFKWASGNTYIGQYKGDERDGIGKMQWTDGSIYIGQWEKGIQHGYGIMIFPDGSIKKGHFNNNVYKGPAPPIPPLCDTNFDIISLAPPGSSFSDEILSFYAVGRTQESSWLPAVNCRDYDSTDESRDRSRLLGNKRKLKNNKKAPRSYSDKRDLVRINKKAKESLEQLNPTTNSRRWLRKGIELKLYKKEYNGTNTTMYSPMHNYSSIVPEILKRKTVKQVWRPAGRAHHRSTVVYNDP